MDRTLFFTAGSTSRSRPQTLAAALRTLDPPRRRNLHDSSHVQPPQVSRNVPTTRVTKPIIKSATKPITKDQKKGRTVLAPAPAGPNIGVADVLWALLFAALTGLLPLPALRILVWSYIFFSLVSKWVEAYRRRSIWKSVG